MSLEFRPIRDAELPQFVEAIGLAYGEDTSLVERLLTPDLLGRTVAAFDEGRIVGMNFSYEFALTVPGGELKAAGVTMVGVLPTHRRRGIMREMMRYQFDDLHERGEPLGVLWASEDSIYQRYGYGLAAPILSYNISSEHSAFLDERTVQGLTTLLDEAAAMKILPQLYDRVRERTPGMFRRSEEWWKQHTLWDPTDSRGDYSQQFRAVWERDGRPEAYALYRIKHDWPVHGEPVGHMLVSDFAAVSASAGREMWRYLLDTDLVNTVEVLARPVDDPLYLTVAEPRFLRVQIPDGLWLRVVDVIAALEGRTYAEDGQLSFALSDHFCDWNEGAYTLRVTDGHGQITATTGEPDLDLRAQELGASYLGGITFTALAAAGRVIEHNPGAARLADRLFYSDVKPFCPETF